MNPTYFPNSMKNTVRELTLLSSKEVQAKAFPILTVGEQMKKERQLNHGYEEMLLKIKMMSLHKQRILTRLCWKS